MGERCHGGHGGHVIVTEVTVVGVCRGHVIVTVGTVVSDEGDIQKHRSWRSTPGQLLKKLAQATPKGLLHLFMLDPHKLSNRLFHLIRINEDEITYQHTH